MILSQKRIQPGVARVMVAAGRVLVARRRGAMAGKWEFPGGKVEAGETLEAVLVRELREEFAVTVEVGRKIPEQPFFNGRVLRLIVFYLRHVSGVYVPVGHRAIRWLDPKALFHLDLTPPGIPAALKVQDHSLTGWRPWLAFGCRAC